MIKTNKVKLDLHYNNIIRDYDVYKVYQEHKGDDEKERTVRKSSMDKIGDKFSPVISVIYKSGGIAYILVEKGTVRLEEFQSYINSFGQGVFVEEIDLSNHTSMSSGDLCQLLINTFPNIDLSEKFNNTLGRCFYFNQNSFKEDVITAYSVTISDLDSSKQECVVNINGESYNLLSKLLKCYANNEKVLKKIRKLPRYYKSGEGYIFREVDSYRSEDQCYVLRGIYGRKNKYIALDLDIKDLQAFENSKKGMLYQFFKDVDNKLKDYVQFTPLELKDDDILKKYSNTISIEHRENLFNDLGINVIDCIEDVLSKKMVAMMVSKLRERGIENVSFSQDKLFNVVLIHDQDYYKKENLPDQHTNDLNTQHFTYENCITKSSEIDINENVVDKILTELIVKMDVANKCLSTYRWEWDKTVEYVMQDLVYNKETRKKERIYLVLTVFPDGSMEFYKVEDDSLDVYQSYDSIFKNNTDAVYTPEMLISTQGYQALISDSLMKVMPDLDELYFRLDAYKKEKEISKGDLVRLLESFMQSQPKYKEEVEGVLKSLNKDTYQYQEIVRKATKTGDAPLINLATSLGKEFVGHCRNNFRMVLNPCLKSDVVNVFQHIYILKDEEEPKKLYYYVGKKDSMKFTLINSCHIRKIMMLEGDFDEVFKNFLFDQLAVDLIRNRGYTVVPFLRKYIEEFK